jgi:hypothetical protein
MICRFWNVIHSKSCTAVKGNELCRGKPIMVTQKWVCYTVLVGCILIFKPAIGAFARKAFLYRMFWMATSISFEPSQPLNSGFRGRKGAFSTFCWRFPYRPEGDGTLQPGCSCIYRWTSQILRYVHYLTAVKQVLMSMFL